MSNTSNQEPSGENKLSASSTVEKGRLTSTTEEYIPPKSDSPSKKVDLAALSIYHIVKLHCRERLVVHPILWTERQVELLQFCFEKSSMAPPTDPPDFDTGSSGSGYVQKMFDRGYYRWVEFSMRRVFTVSHCPLSTTL